MRKRSTNKMTTSPLDELSSLVSVKDAAQMLGISTESVFRYYHAGELPGTMFGGKLRFRISDIEKLYKDSWHKGPEKRPYTKKPRTKTRPHAKKSHAVGHEQPPTES